MEHTEEHAHHIVQPRTYFIIYVMLLILMAATILAAQIDLGALNNVIAMGIAVVKALLVILFFMQVKYSSKVTWLWAAIGFLWLFILFGALSDYMTREWITVFGW